MKPSVLTETGTAITAASIRTGNASAPAHWALVPECAGLRPEPPHAGAWTQALRQAIAAGMKAGSAFLTVRVSRERAAIPAAGLEPLSGLIRDTGAEYAARGVRFALLLPAGAGTCALSAAVNRQSGLLRGPEALRVTLALEYDGRAELAAAMQDCVAERSRNPGGLDAAEIERHLPSGPLPPVDFIVHTGTAGKLSDFLLWKSAYAELFFTETPFAVMRQEDFETALADYTVRRRTFGALPSGLQAG